MKTYVKNAPFSTEQNNDKYISLVLSEKETFWVYAEDNACYPFMHDLLEQKIEKVKSRYKKTIKVFDNNGKVIKEI